ncbi:MAG: HesA/MoeB/ThiF family protein [Bacteroidota bacterium]|nr:HesA/MoeB/ThiF family protein [Bacteroidota bacterium]MDP3144181.1 HesA/MoeB/ThiF family protein [Bacteroidota bacterium]
MLSKEEFKRYQKQIMLDDIGINGQIKIKKAKVAVVGAGGLGCPVLQYLVSVGVGTIGVIDFDTVEESNLHRQVLYSQKDIGKLKVEVAIEKLSAQNPYVKLIPHRVLLNDINAESVLSDYDIVIDGCDNFLTRYVVNDICVKLNKPLIYGSILDYQGQLAVFNYKGSKNLRDIFPEPPSAEDVPNCSENGVLGTIPAVIGSMMAQNTLNVILEQNISINTLFIFNVASLEMEKFNF